MNRLIELKHYVRCTPSVESGLKQFPYMRNGACIYMDDLIEMLVQSLGSKFCTVAMQNKEALTANYIIENVNSIIMKNDHKILDVDKIELWVNSFINNLGIYVKLSSVDMFLDELTKMINKGKLDLLEVAI